MPLRILSCRVSRVGPVSSAPSLDSCLRTRTRAACTPLFCCCNTFRPWQTTPRGLPGNCWKHQPSVYSVIEVRWSHLAAYDHLESTFSSPGTRHGRTPSRGSANFWKARCHATFRGRVDRYDVFVCDRLCERCRLVARCSE